MPAPPGLPLAEHIQDSNASSTICLEGSHVDDLHDLEGTRNVLPSETLVVLDFDCTCTAEHLFHTLRKEDGKQAHRDNAVRFCRGGAANT